MVKKVVLVGYMAHVCVFSTTRAAVELGYDALVVSNAGSKYSTYQDVAKKPPLQCVFPALSHYRTALCLSNDSIRFKRGALVCVIVNRY
jgi:nicotinamidase-related amidase